MSEEADNCANECDLCHFIVTGDSFHIIPRRITFKKYI